MGFIWWNPGIFYMTLAFGFLWLVRDNSLYQTLIAMGLVYTACLALWNANEAEKERKHLK